MIRFNLFRHRRGAAQALRIAAAIAVIGAAGTAAAQDSSANPNVIVDESVLDSVGATTDNGLLTPPDRPPVSRLVTTTGSMGSSSGLVFPPETTSDATFTAVPTTPIHAAPLDGDAPDAAATAEPAAGTEAAEQQTAARTPLDGMVRVAYEPGATAIPEPSVEALEALVARLDADYLLRVQVLAYAAGDESEAMHARGVSLARALAMRDYLSREGIGMDRMDIRALGNTAQEEPADRVDLIPLAQ